MGIEKDYKEIKMREIKRRIWGEVKKWYLSYKRLDTILWFGKYKGQSIKQIVDKNAQYIEWCLDKKIFKLGWFVKLYYLKKLKCQKELMCRYLIWLYELEKKYGAWMDDGQGNCGFVKEDEY